MIKIAFIFVLETIQIKFKELLLDILMSPKVSSQGYGIDSNTLAMLQRDQGQVVRGKRRCDDRVQLHSNRHNVHLACAIHACVHHESLQRNVTRLLKER
jgi:hypothetical protein